METTMTAWQMIPPQPKNYLPQQTTSYLDGLRVELSTTPANRLDQRTMTYIQANVSLAQQSLNCDDVGLAAEYLDQALRLLSRVAPMVVSSQASAQPKPQSDERLNKLSDREREVLQLLAEGKSAAVISELLHLSITTVYTYHRRIKAKLNLHDLPSLTRFALDHQLVE